MLINGKEYEIRSCANLRGADLSGAGLSGANLRGTDLRSADLRDADLRSANLRSADLRNANLRGAGLSGAYLSGADLYLTHIGNPAVFLMAKWGNVSKGLCLFLMRYDAANHSNPERFIKWGKGGPCPYLCEKYTRSANFNEMNTLIQADFLSVPVKSALELAEMLITEKCRREG